MLGVVHIVFFFLFFFLPIYIIVLWYLFAFLLLDGKIYLFLSPVHIELYAEQMPLEYFNILESVSERKLFSCAVGILFLDSLCLFASVRLSFFH